MLWLGNRVTGIGPTPDDNMELQYRQGWWVRHPCLHHHCIRTI